VRTAHRDHGGPTLAEPPENGEPRAPCRAGFPGGPPMPAVTGCRRGISGPNPPGVLNFNERHLPLPVTGARCCAFDSGASVLGPTLFTCPRLS
jgi:hypothetical protein